MTAGMNAANAAPVGRTPTKAKRTASAARTVQAPKSHAASESLRNGIGLGKFIVSPAPLCHPTPPQPVKQGVSQSVVATDTDEMLTGTMRKQYLPPTRHFRNSTA